MRNRAEAISAAAGAGDEAQGRGRQQAQAHPVAGQGRAMQEEAAAAAAAALDLLELCPDVEVLVVPADLLAGGIPGHLRKAAALITPKSSGRRAQRCRRKKAGRCGHDRRWHAPRTSTASISPCSNYPASRRHAANISRSDLQRAGGSGGWVGGVSPSTGSRSRRRWPRPTRAVVASAAHSADSSQQAISRQSAGNQPTRPRCALSTTAATAPRSSLKQQRREGSSRSGSCRRSRRCRGSSG